MKFRGLIRKMETRLESSGGENMQEARYRWVADEGSWEMNDLLDRILTIRFTGEIHCIHCGRLTRKSYGQGYCYPCFISLPETDVCILRPELCQAHLGISRDMTWAEQNCLQDHFVYLALSGGLKVGVTRASQIPTRWIDQGARQAIVLAKTPNRNTAGLIEVALKKQMSDKTNWRLMLTTEAPEDENLVEVKHRVRDLIPENLRSFYLGDDTITRITYPVLAFPEKVKTITLDKTASFHGRLVGIRGQYLIFDEGRVFNVRRHTGYLTEIEVN